MMVEKGEFSLSKKKKEKRFKHFIWQLFWYHCIIELSNSFCRLVFLKVNILYKLKKKNLTVGYADFPCLKKITKKSPKIYKEL